MAALRFTGLADYLRQRARQGQAAYRRHRLARAIGDFDALLVSYPKSGRTWLRFILANYFGQKIGKGHQVDLHTMFAFLPNFAWDRVRGVQAMLASDLKRSELPLIAVTHDLASFGSGKLLPVIFIVRDPRDVLVSSYFHATRHRHRFAGDIAAFVRDPSQGLPHHVRYLNQAAGLLASRPHHVISYEQLSNQPLHAMATALRFLGHEPDLEKLDRAIADAAIDRMRAIEADQGIPAHEYDRSDPEALRVRRGVVGGFADYLSADTQQWFERFCASNLDADAAVRLVEHNSQKALVGQQRAGVAAFSR